jgi:hypothetical protein
MAEPNRPYLAYLLRLWQANTQQGPVWRASVESPHTAERQAFADLAQLFTFLERRAGEEEDKQETRLKE